MTYDVCLIQCSSTAHWSSPLVQPTGPAHMELYQFFLFMPNCFSTLFFTVTDMKKDIETLIAEERAEIILKYATVSKSFRFWSNLLPLFHLYNIKCLINKNVLY